MRLSKNQVPMRSAFHDMGSSCDGHNRVPSLRTSASMWQVVHRGLPWQSKVEGWSHTGSDTRVLSENTEAGGSHTREQPAIVRPFDAQIEGLTRRVALADAHAIAATFEHGVPLRAADALDDVELADLFAPRLRVHRSGVSWDDRAVHVDCRLVHDSSRSSPSWLQPICPHS